MPRIYDAKRGAEIEVSDQHFRTMVDGGTPVLRVLPADGNRQALWDRIESAWTKPFPRERLYDCYLKKQIWWCTSCSWTTMGDKSQWLTHVRSVAGKAEAHQGARVDVRSNERGERVEGCTACAVSYGSKPGRCYGHIQSTLQEGPRHRGAEVVLIYRYSLERTEPLSSNGSGPHASEVERSLRPKRRRRRRHNRGGHGNG